MISQLITTARQNNDGERPLGKLVREPRDPEHREVRAEHD